MAVEEAPDWVRAPQKELTPEQIWSRWAAVREVEAALGELVIEVAKDLAPGADGDFSVALVGGSGSLSRRDLAEANFTWAGHWFDIPPPPGGWYRFTGFDPDRRYGNFDGGILLWELSPAAGETLLAGMRPLFGGAGEGPAAEVPDDDDFG